MKIERDSRKIMAVLLRAGFEVVLVRGPHHKLRKGAPVVIVPHSKKDLPSGTARSIYRQAGLI